VSFYRGTSNDSRFGLQPIRAVMERERWTCKDLAERVNVPRSLVPVHNGTNLTFAAAAGSATRDPSDPTKRSFYAPRVGARVRVHVDRQARDQASKRQRSMNAEVRDALRRAGAEAGRKARQDAGLPMQVEDHQAVQRMAELLIKAGDQR
jgi:hypothetical protein